MASSILLPIPIPDLAILIPSNSEIGIEGNSNYIPRIRRIGGCYGFMSKPPAMVLTR